MEDVEARSAAAELALVVDVVVDEQGVVEELDGDGSTQRLLGPRAESPGGGDAEARAHHLAAPAGVVRDQVVEIAPRLEGRQVAPQGLAGERAVLLEHRLDPR